MKTSEVLYKAGDVLRERGWTTGVRGNFPDAPSVCLLGAINSVRGWGDIYGLAGLLPLTQVIGSDNLWQWNDDRGRTAAEVMIALDAAYVVALQEEGIEPEDVL